jgi:general stress protein 26
MDFTEVRALAQEMGPLASFCTAARDGTPHVVPLVPQWDDEHLVFGSRAGSLKVRHLRDREVCAVQYLSKGTDFPDALMLKGVAVVLDDDASREHYWNCGLFPILPKIYAGPTDPELCFVRFSADRASLIREAGRGAPVKWRRSAGAAA